MFFVLGQLIKYPLTKNIINLTLYTDPVSFFSDMHPVYCTSVRHTDIFLLFDLFYTTAIRGANQTSAQIFR